MGLHWTSLLYIYLDVYYSFVNVNEVNLIIIDYFNCKLFMNLLNKLFGFIYKKL